MTTKISGDTGIDVAQLRPADGDPVAMTIAADGLVTATQMPAFDAQSNVAQAISTTGNYLPFPDVLLASPHFVPASGTFTAPVTGLYHFDWVVMGDATVALVNSSLHVNGADRCNGSRGATSAFCASAGSTTTILLAGQTARINVNTTVNQNTNTGGSVVRFSGYFVKATT
jgi:hypothetical protein